MSAESNGGRERHPDRADWMAAASMGGIATTPLVLAVVGWASSWNAYTNLNLTLGGVLLWVVLWVAWRNA